MDRAEFTPDALRLCGNASQVAYKAKKAGNAGAGHTGAGRRGRKGYAEGAEEYKNIQMRKQSQTAFNPAANAQKSCKQCLCGLQGIYGLQGAWGLVVMVLLRAGTRECGGRDAEGAKVAQRKQKNTKIFKCESRARPHQTQQQISKRLASSVYAGYGAFMGCKAHECWLLGYLALAECRAGRSGRKRN